MMRYREDFFWGMDCGKLHLVAERGQCESFCGAFGNYHAQLHGTKDPRDPNVYHVSIGGVAVDATPYLCKKCLRSWDRWPVSKDAAA